jgi:predicted metalloprotease
MLWKGRRQSANVEDRRGGGVPGRVAGGGLGTLVIILLVWLLGGNPLEVLQTISTADYPASEVSTQQQPDGDSRREFVSVVLADTEEIWGRIFREQGMAYRPPRLVLFSSMVQSACGLSQAATGPFYCPGDEKVYIDLDFLEELQHRFRAEGDFAAAYIIAHEVGHHVQKQLGITQKVMAMQNRVSEAEFNRSMVRLELQADFFAGVWAHYAKRMNLLEAGDLDEALNAAAAVGDDRIQKQSQGYAVPDSFTHGTAEQRARWFHKGYTTGDMSQGDTFSVAEL